MRRGDLTPRVRAALVVVGALGAGGLTQALFWDVHVGAGWLVLDLLLVLATIVSLGRDAESGRLEVTLPTAAVAGSALALGAAPVYYASAWAFWLAFPANAALLLLLPFLVTRRVRAGDLHAVPRALLDGARRVPAAIVKTAEIPHRALDAGSRRSAGSVLRGLVIGAPVAGGFAALLSADAGFARALHASLDQSGGAARFVGLSVLSASAYLVWYVLHTEAGAGTQREDRREDLRPYHALPRELPEARHTRARHFALGPVTWATVLLQLIAVFGLFAIVNAKVLFAGHALARAHGTVTYARYLHAGFAQLSFAALLAVVTIVVGHQLVKQGPPWLAGIETTLLGLTGVALASCWQRLHVYEVAYGYTYLRLAVAMCQAAVLALLLLTGAKSILRRWRGYWPAAAVTTLAFVVLAAWFNADLYIARGNIERAALESAGRADPYAWRELDLDYLAGLSADARPVLRHPFLQSNVEVADALRKAWIERDALRARGWRSFRGISGRF